MFHLHASLKQKAIIIAGAVLTPGLIVFGVMQSQLSAFQEDQKALIGEVYQWSDAVDLAHQNAHETTKVASAFKNAIVRGHVEKDYQKYRAEIGERGQEFANNLQAILAMPVIQRDSGLVARLSSWGEGMSVLVKQYEAAADTYVADNPYTIQTADALVRGKDKELNKQVAEFEEVFIAGRTQSKENLVLITNNKLEAVLTGFAFAMFVSMLLAGGLAFYMMRLIKKQLGDEPEALVARVNRMAEGDFRLDAGDASCQRISQSSVLGRLM